LILFTMQNLIDEKLFSDLYNSLLDEFRSANAEQLSNIYSSTVEQVKEWKYATDTYFTIQPLENEINKLKPGKLLKDGDNDNPKIRVHSFGFDEGNRLILFEYPLSNDADQYGYYTNCNLYIDQAIKTYVIHRYVENKRPPSLVNLKVFQPINACTKLALSVNGVKPNQWLLQTYYHSENGSLEKISRHDPGFNVTVDYKMVYDDKGLERIIAGNDLLQWKRK